MDQKISNPPVRKETVAARLVTGLRQEFDEWIWDEFAEVTTITDAQVYVAHLELVRQGLASMSYGGEQ